MAQYKVKAPLHAFREKRDDAGKVSGRSFDRFEPGEIVELSEADAAKMPQSVELIVDRSAAAQPTPKVAAS